MTIKPSITLPTDIMEALKRKAAARHVSMSRLFSQLAASFIKDDSDVKDDEDIIITAADLDRSIAEVKAGKNIKKYDNAEDFLKELAYYRENCGNV